MTGKTASQAISTVDNAIAKANEVRSEIGAYQNRFDQTTDNLSVSTENMTSSLSNMIDTDMAEEMTQYTSMTVLTQAATSILSQANQRPSTVLQLLQK
jgi:flagellin